MRDRDERRYRVTLAGYRYRTFSGMHGFRRAEGIEVDCLLARTLHISKVRVHMAVWRT